jgi:hypothetical protein
MERHFEPRRSVMKAGQDMRPKPGLLQFPLTIDFIPGHKEYRQLIDVIIDSLKKGDTVRGQDVGQDCQFHAISS